MKKIIIFLLLTMPIISFGQNDTCYLFKENGIADTVILINPDTLFIKKVALVDMLINKKTGMVVKKWVKHKKVKKGYIVNLYGNVWEVNGKLMYSDNNRDYSFVK